MHRPAYQRDRGRFDVKMTPMIDVVFLLLIFFVCTASFQVPEEVLPTHLQVPGKGVSQAPPDPLLEELEEVLVRVVSHDGKIGWRVNDRPYDQLQQVRAVFAQLARIRTDLPVILDIDPEVPLGDVIDVYDICRMAGFEQVQFAAASEA